MATERQLSILDKVNILLLQISQLKKEINELTTRRDLLMKDLS